jgi:RsiW-degrading membrane proteinase PrsW (M82 family)
MVTSVLVTSALAVSAIVPSLLLVWYFHWRDLYPEPGLVIWTTFGLGVATIPVVLLVAESLPWPLESIPSAYLAGFLGAFLMAAIPEELLKLLVVRGYCARHRDFSETMDGVVYGAVASLGFATLENVLYVTATGFTVAVARALTAVPAHAFMGAIMGYYVGRARFHPNERTRANVMAWLVPTILHGLYDYPLLTRLELQARNLPAELGAIYLPITPVVFVTLWVWAIRSMRRARADQEAAPVPLPAAGAPRPHRGSQRIGGTVLLLLGLVFATGGGLVVLGVITALATGHLPYEPVQIIVGAAIVGGLVLVAGLVLFALGIRSLNRPSPSVPGPRRF